MRYVIFILCFISLQSTANTCDSLSFVKSLLGSWELNRGGQVITESWYRVSDQTIEGKGVVYESGIIKSSESLRIMEMSNSVFYLAKVSHNKLPIAFILSQCSDNLLIFENIEHDFPKRIVYSMTSKNSLVVNVSDGSSKSFKLHYKRVIDTQ